MASLLRVRQRPPDLNVEIFHLRPKAHFLFDAHPEFEVAYHVGSAETDPVSGKIYTDWARDLFGKNALFPEANSPNNCTIGIEICHIDWDGNFTPATLDTAAEVGACYCRAYNLDPIMRTGTHNLTVGWKDCPPTVDAQSDAAREFPKRSEVKRRMEA